MTVRDRQAGLQPLSMKKKKDSFHSRRGTEMPNPDTPDGLVLHMHSLCGTHTHGLTSVGNARHETRL